MLFLFIFIDSLSLCAYTCPYMCLCGHIETRGMSGIMFCYFLSYSLGTRSLDESEAGFAASKLHHIPITTFPHYISEVTSTWDHAQLLLGIMGI